MEKIIKNKIPSIRTVAMPADTNSSGDIFGGWVLSQMDLAGGVLATQVSKKRITTVAIDKMRFHKPIKVGDIVSFYTQVNNTGNTSITIDIETFVTRKNDQLEKNQEIDALVLRSERQISDINNLVGRSDEQLREISRLVQKCDGYLSEIKALVYNCDSLKDERNKLTNDVLEYNRVNQELSFKMNELSSLNILIQEKLEYATKHPFSFCLNTLLNK